MKNKRTGMSIIAAIDTKETKGLIADGCEQFIMDKEEEQHYSFMDSNEYVTKNKAHEEAKLVFRAMDRKIIASSMVENFKDAFREAITKVNARNKRCKDLVLDIWEPNEKGDWFISLPGACSLTLRKAKFKAKESPQICYKTNKPCEHNCKGLCKESC